jgi:iron complex transport system ATP-binding protein
VLRVEADEVAAALRRVARRGPFFDLRAGATSEDGDGPTGWLPFSELDSPAAREARDRALARLTARLGVADLRPVASLLQMSLAARLCSPLLATAAEFGLIACLEPQHVSYAFPDRGSILLRLDAIPTGCAGTPDELAGELQRVLTDGVLASFTSALGTSVALSPQTTNGNIASTLVAAAQILSRTPGSDAIGSRGFELVDLLLAKPPLAGTGAFRSADPRSERSFRRRSCCLFYRIPNRGICGDCVLAT